VGVREFRIPIEAATVPAPERPAERRVLVAGAPNCFRKRRDGLDGSFLVVSDVRAVVEDAMAARVSPRLQRRQRRIGRVDRAVRSFEDGSLAADVVDRRRDGAPAVATDTIGSERVDEEEEDICSHS